MVWRSRTRTQQPLPPRHCLVDKTRLHQSQQSECCIAQPAVAIVLVARSTDLLRKRRRHRCDNASGRLVRQSLQYHKRALHRVRIRYPCTDPSRETSAAVSQCLRLCNRPRFLPHVAALAYAASVLPMFLPRGRYSCCNHIPAGRICLRGNRMHNLIGCGKRSIADVLSRCNVALTE